jgi:hypothetical protein
MHTHKLDRSSITQCRSSNSHVNACVTPCVCSARQLALRHGPLPEFEDPDEAEAQWQSSMYYTHLRDKLVLASQPVESADEEQPQ